MASTPYPLPRQTRESSILVGNGTVGPYGPTTFKVFDVEDIEIWAKADGESVFSEVSSADYTVTKTADLGFDTVSVTFDASVPATTSFVIRAARTAERSIAVTKAGAINANQLEKELSKLATTHSELRRDLDRTVQTDPGQAPVRLKVGASGQVPGYDDAGNLVPMTPEAATVASVGLPTITAAGDFLQRNVANTAYEGKTAAQVAEAIGLPALAANTLLVTNAGGNARENKTFAETRGLLTAAAYVASRAALAALALAGAAILTEAGREGTFNFVASNLSGLVTADTAQALYVAPASDPTGASGAWVRQRDGLYILDKWAGAKVDDATDDAPATQAAINLLKFMGGGQLELAPGTGRWNSTVTIDNSGVISRFAERINIHGMGSTFTARRTNGLAAPAFAFVGNATYVESHLRLEGWRLTGNLAASSIGVDVSIGAFLSWTDFIAEGFDINFRANDIEQSLFTRCNFRWGNHGVVIEGSTATTDPNELTWVECAIGNNFRTGLTATNANRWKFVSSSVQYNGETGQAGDYGAKFINPSTGYPTLDLSGLIFEGNGGDADLWVADAAGIAILRVQCSFARPNNTNYATNCIRFDGASTTKILKLAGGTDFKHYNGYVPNAGRPYLNLASDVQIDCDPSVWFESATEAPPWAYIGGARASRQDGYRLFRTGADINAYIANSFSVAGGVMLQALNDALSGLIPLELRASAIRLTPSGGVGIGLTAARLLDLAAGTAAKGAFGFTAGANMTNVTAGTWEYDGKALYFAVANSARGVVPAKQIAAVAGAAVALTNNITTAQNIFAAAGDVLTLAANTTYRFRARLKFNTGATSHTTAFGLGGTATFTSIGYTAQSISAAANTLATPQQRDVESAAAAVLTAASTAVTTSIVIEGILRTNAAGTIIPQVTFSAGPTGTCETAINSFFEVEPIGDDTVAAVGQWA
jgi:hypothetical protein